MANFIAEQISKTFGSRGTEQKIEAAPAITTALRIKNRRKKMIEI